MALSAGTILFATIGTHEARATDVLGIEAGVAIGSEPLPDRPTFYAGPRYSEPPPAYVAPGPAPMPPLIGCAASRSGMGTAGCVPRYRFCD